MKITVTLDDIQKGCRKCPTDCPVSRAIKRATGEPFIMVCTLGYYKGTGLSDNLNEFKNPQVTEWIRGFDMGAACCEPFEFELT